MLELMVWGLEEKEGQNLADYFIKLLIVIAPIEV